MIRKYLCFYILCLSFWACDSASNEAIDANSGEAINTASSGYQLQIVDSLIISTLPSETYIQDIHPENGNILMMQRRGRGQILMETDGNGKILQTFKHPSDGPTKVGSNLLSACYFDDGFALMGSFGALLFTDNQFEPLRRKRIPMGFDLSAYPGFRHLQVLNIDGKSMLVLFYGAHTEMDNTESTYYEAYNLLSMYNPETDEFSPIGGLPEASIFRNGKAHYFLDTRFQVVGEEVKAIITGENLLYTVALEGGKIAHRQIPFDDFVLHEGFSLGPKGMDEQGDIREIDGTIRSYLQVGDKEVFVYSSGLTLDARQAIAGDGKDKEAWVKLRKALPTKYLIMQNGKAANAFISLPERIGYLTMVDAGGNIWATQNVDAMDEEPDVVTIYKLRIQAL